MTGAWHQSYNHKEAFSHIVIIKNGFITLAER